MLNGITIIETVAKPGQSIVLFILAIFLAIACSAATIYLGVIMPWQNKKKIGLLGCFFAIVGILMGIVVMQMAWLECHLPTTTYTIEIADSTSYVKFFNTYEIVSESDGKYVVQTLKEITNNNARMRNSSIWCLTLIGGWFIVLLFWIGIEDIIQVTKKKNVESDHKSKESKKTILASVFLIIFAMLCTYGLVWCWQSLAIAPESMSVVGPYEAVDSTIYHSGINGVSIVGIVNYGGVVAIVLAIVFTIFAVIQIIDAIKETKNCVAEIKSAEDEKKKTILKVKCAASVVLAVAFIILYGIICYAMANNETHYIATIDKSVSFNEFVEKYEVVESDGTLYEIRDVSEIK